MKTKRFRCGRLYLNQNGIIEKLDLENGGGSRYCHWFGKQMNFVQVHRQIRKIYGLSDPQIHTKLYDYQKQPLNTGKYRTFHDYIDSNGLSGNSIAIYLYTYDEDVDNDVISNVLSSKEIIPYVDQSINTFRMSHAIEYSFINEINRLKRYVRELINENGIDSVLLQLFENFCTIYGYVFSILLPLQQQQNDPTKAVEITVYLNNLEKIYEIFESTKTLLHRNMSNYRRNRTYSTVRSTFFQFYNNVQILRNRWLRNDTRKIDSTLPVLTHSDERKPICVYIQGCEKKLDEQVSLCLSTIKYLLQILQILKPEKVCVFQELLSSSIRKMKLIRSDITLLSISSLVHVKQQLLSMKNQFQSKFDEQSIKSWRSENDKIIYKGYRSTVKSIRLLLTSLDSFI